MKLQLFVVIALGLGMLTACVSEEDKVNAKRRVEMDSEQAALIGEGADCGKSLKDLDDWYAANKAEVDKLDAWMEDKSEGAEKRMMEPYSAQRKSNFRARMMGTLKCGFVPWNGRREPTKK